jgi:peptidyl-dipeptidase Dcp
MKSLVLIGAIVSITIACKQKNMNPLLVSEFNTPYQTAPFNNIKLEHFKPAFIEAMERGKAEVTAIKQNPQEPTFENTIEALEFSGMLLARTSGIFFNLLGTENNEEIQLLAQELSPLLTAYSNDISLDEKLFERVNKVHDQKEALTLTPEQEMLLNKTYLGFIRNGANLDSAQKQQLRSINEELSQLKLTFGNNVLAETNGYSKLVTDSSLLAGIPDNTLALLKSNAARESKEGWLLDISMPVYMAVMKYAENRELRKELFLAFGSKGVKQNANNNEETVRRIVELRLQRTKLLGYDTYADYVLTERMAENAENVTRFLDKLYEASLPAALREIEAVKNKAATEGLNSEFMPWDWSYYSEKLQTELFDLNDEMMKPYFKLENVIDGVFGLATDLFGLTFVPGTEIQVYNPEVKAYEVFDTDGTFLAVLYADFHPRKSKRGGAWMNEFKGQWVRNGVDSRPHITIVMNFTPSTEDEPSLLTYNEVETFLHEFGHALHGMMAKSTYGSLSGTNVYRDFVELPSQILENWGTCKEFLDRFAFHYQTGEKIPESLIQKIKAAANFNAGYFSIRQLGFADLDMAWHTLNEPYNGDVRAFEAAALKRTTLLPTSPENCLSTAFGHLFSGGYAAGYYSYKWAEVLDADAFALFEEQGIYNRNLAESFRRNILEKGGTEHPMVLYKKFRGTEPSIDALLKRSGLN